MDGVCLRMGRTVRGIHKQRQNERESRVGRVCGIMDRNGRSHRCKEIGIICIHVGSGKIYQISLSLFCAHALCYGRPMCSNGSQTESAQMEMGIAFQ